MRRPRAVKRTHYSCNEFNQKVRDVYPDLSASVMMWIENKYNIRPLRAGCDRVYSVKSLDLFLEVIKNHELVRRGEFLVLKELEKYQ